MYFDWAYFGANVVMLVCYAFLLVFTVRDRLKIPLKKLLTFAGIAILTVCTITALFEDETFNLAMVIFLPVCFMALQRVIDIRRGKLLFLYCVVASYACFVSAMAIALNRYMPEAGLFMASNPSYLSVGAALLHGSTAVLFMIPAFIVLRAKIWPLVRDLDMFEWSHLWIVPLVISLFFLMSTMDMQQATIPLWAFCAGNSLLACGAFISYYLIVQMMQKTADSVRMAERTRHAEMQLNLQRDQYERLQEGILETRKARHDLRHSLAVLSGFAHAGDLERLNTYLAEVQVQLPRETEERVCENHAANAIVNHYLAMAAEASVHTSTQLIIPENVGGISSMDLCVLLGNMLENAVEASARLKPGQRSISLLSAISGDYLTINMENRFDGVFEASDGVFASRKHEGEGIGLSSIRAIAQKYYGHALFTAQGDLFETSVILCMTALKELDEPHFARYDKPAKLGG